MRITILEDIHNETYPDTCFELLICTFQNKISPHLPLHVQTWMDYNRPRKLSNLLIHRSKKLKSVIKCESSKDFQINLL